MPSAIEAEVRRQYRVRLVGRLETVRQRFYAITVERKLRNPAVIASRARTSAVRLKRRERRLGAIRPRPHAVRTQGEDR